MIAGVDLYSPSSYAAGHPAGQYAWLRDNDPVHWHSEPDGPGFWAVTRHEDVKAVSRDTESKFSGLTSCWPTFTPNRV